MSLAAFFKKDAVIMPSGEEAQSGRSCYGRALETAGMIAAGVVLASVMVSCGPSREEIEAMKNRVSPRDRNELTAAYDSTLLVKIDSLHAAGASMKSAVKHGLSLTWEQARRTMPKRKEWSGKEYVVSDYADQCWKDGIDVKTEMKYAMSITKPGKMTFRPVTTHEGRPEFREELAKRIAGRKTAVRMAVRQAAVAKQAGK